MESAAEVGREFHCMIGLPARVARSVSAMRTGTVLLSVPLLDDVIQVGTADSLATGTIEVVKTPSAMVVRRTDGRPLQAQILHQHVGGSASRTPVFLEPVRSLRLLCVPQSAASELWLAVPGGQIRRRPDLFQLIETISAFGLAKQRRLSSSGGNADVIAHAGGHSTPLGCAEPDARADDMNDPSTLLAAV